MNNIKKAFSLVEIVVVLTLFLIFSGGYLSLYYVSDFAVQSDELREKALNYAQEGIQIVMGIGSDNILNINDGNYALQKNGSDYLLIPAAIETLDGIYSRTVRIDPVMRNSGNQIDEEGEVFDSLTKKISSIVQWGGPFGDNKSVNLQTYITDWNGSRWTQTTETDFNSGTADRVDVLPSDQSIIDNGKVELKMGGGGVDLISTTNVLSGSRDVYFKDNLAYVANDSKNNTLCVVDVANPNLPVRLSCLDLDVKATSVVVVGSYAYVGLEGSSSKNLAIVNISDSNSPQIVSYFDVCGYVNDLTFQGNHLFLAVDESKYALTIMNVADPESPYVVSGGYCNSPSSNDKRRVKLKDDYIYLLGDKILQILDTVNLNNPQVVSTVDLGHNGNAIYFYNNYLYVGRDDGKIAIYNIQDPANPTFVSLVDAGQQVMDLAGRGNLLFSSLNSAATGGKIYDLANPELPVLLENVDLDAKSAAVFTDETLNFIYWATDDSHAGLVIMNNDREIVDDVNVQGDKVVDVYAQHRTDGYEYAFVASDDDEAGLCAYKINAVSGDAIEASCLNTDDEVNTLYGSGNYLYLDLEDNDELMVVDITNPSSMAVISTLEVCNSVSDTFVADGLLFLAMDRKGYSLGIYDLSDPEIPARLYGVNCDISYASAAESIFFADNYVYLGEAESLAIIDVSNFLDIFQVSSTDMPDAVSGITVNDNFAYVALNNGETGLLVIDVSDPSVPENVGSYVLGGGGEGYDLDVNGGYLYVSAIDGDEDLYVFDAGNPLILEEINNLSFSGRSRRMYLTGSYLYLATDDSVGGLVIIKTKSNDFEMAGSLVSSIHDSGSEGNNYEHVSWLASVPPSTEIKFQIRSADAAEAIDSASFVGPDGSSSTFYDVAPAIIQLDPAREGDRYLQWKALLSGDSNATSTLESVTIKYE